MQKAICMVPPERLNYAASTSASRASPNVAAVNRLFGLGRSGSSVPILEDVPAPAGGIVFVTGPSGAGKSTFLRLLRETRPGAHFCEPPREADKPLVDLFGSNFAAIIAWLGRFGLGEARVMTTPYSHLSDGQKARAMLALATWERPDCIIADEFLSILDRTNARLVAFNFQKICRAEKIDAFLATAHDDLVEALAPDHVLRLELGAESHLETSSVAVTPAAAELRELEFCEGNASDFRKLSRFHYIEHLASEGPLSDLEWEHVVSQVRVARYRGRPIAVAVFSRPFPDLLNSIPFFRLVNERLLIVLRVVVHPTFRGVGLTKELLQPRLTSHLGAIVACSALGIHFPFFLGAGFVRINHPRCLRYHEHDRLDVLLGACSPELLEDLNDYGCSQLYYGSLTAIERQRLRTTVTEICVRMNVDYAEFHGRIAGLELEPNDRMAVERIFRRLTEQVPDESFGTMLSEALYFPAAGFIKMLS